MTLTCTKCNEPCKPRKDRPEKYFSLCEGHWKDHNKISTRKRYYTKYRLEKKRLQLKSAEWDAKNPEKRKAIEARRRATGAPALWKKENREKVNAGTRRYQYRQRSRSGAFTNMQLQARIDFYGHRCYLCGCDWEALDPFDKTIDHVIPLSKDGTNWPSNLRPACRSCNSKKSDTKGLCQTKQHREPCAEHCESIEHALSVA